MIKMLSVIGFALATLLAGDASTDLEDSPSLIKATSSDAGAEIAATESFVKDIGVDKAVSQALTTDSDAPVAGVYVHIPEPDAEPVVEEWFVRQQGGQCVVGSDDGSGSVIQECQTIPEGRPGPTEESPSPEPEESEDSEESEPEPVFITLTASEFAELPLATPEVTVQPDRGWVLVNMETVVYADDAPQVLTTELLGVPVAVRATPVEFAWDFGDGAAPVVTTSGGQPWPNQT